MLQIVDKCSLEIGQRVECYYNSKNQMISVRSMDVRNEHYSKIVAYTEFIHLEDVQFVYSATNNRKIFRGIYAGSLPIVPKVELLILHNKEGFFNTSRKEVVGAKYAVLYKDLLIAEQSIEKRSGISGDVYRKRVL